MADQRSRPGALARVAITGSAGTVALVSLLKTADVSRTVVQRLVREGKLVVWEEPLAPEQAPFATDLLLPINLLNAEQTHIVQTIGGWLQARAFHPALLYG